MNPAATAPSTAATAESRVRRSVTARVVATLLGLALLPGSALATWSIVVVNRATGEVGVGTASCITGSIRGVVPLVVVGRGAAATQATPSGLAKARIWNDLHAGVAPLEILAALPGIDPFHQTRQYGITGFGGPPATFTGMNVGQGLCGLTGTFGDIEYAIQGNVMVGPEVCLVAEEALIRTPGDLSQKLMAAMDAARRIGGDGRCSCNGGAPTSCGVPPPGFVKSAHAGAVLLARPGDVDDDACPAGGCAGGSYYLELEYTGGQSDPDPVLVMLDQYAQWRAGLAGAVDHVRTEVGASDQRLVADGATATTVTVRLRDLEGAPVSSGGFVLRVVQTLGDAIADVGPPTHAGGDAYAFDLTATTTSGRGQYTIVVDDGTRAVQLHPPLVIDSAPVAELVSTRWDLSAAGGGGGGVVLNLAAHAGEPYHVYGGFSGTVPGTPVGGGLVVPLARDRLFDLTEQNPAHRGLNGFVGVLDSGGRAEARLAFVPGALTPLVGARMQFAAVVGAGAGARVTGVDGFAIAP